MIKFWQQKDRYFLVGIVLLYSAKVYLQIVPTVAQPSVAGLYQHKLATPFPSVGLTSGEFYATPAQLLPLSLRL